MNLRRTHLLILTSVIFCMLVICKRVAHSPLTTLHCPANIFSNQCNLNTMAKTQRLDLVRMTAADIQNLLKSGDLTSVELVKETLAQIKRHNLQGLKLRAVISTAPENLVLETAARLDAERATGKTRGPFHGLPILLKDAIKTSEDLGMPTTVGSFSLVNARAQSSARIVDKLVERGLIIIGKTNLNELVSWKAIGSTNGWSAVGGQTNSAYVEGGIKMEDGVMGHTNPCGASTGSAVGVSAGFSPLALGTEVDGSLVQPAARAGLYAIKSTIGSTELEGVFVVSEDFDSLGAMAKSSRDLALLAEIILTPEERAKLPSDGYLSFLKMSFENLSIGFADPALWRWPENLQPQHGNSAEQLRSGYMQAMERAKDHGARVVFPVALPDLSGLTLDGMPATLVAIRHVFKETVDGYLQSLSSSDIRTVEDIAKYNKEHPEEEFTPEHPEQGRLLHTLENPISRELYEEAMTLCHKVARDQGIDKAMEEHQLDLIALPMDSPCPRLAAAAGYPIGTVPLGALDHNGRPFGLAIIAKAGREDLILALMSAFEAVSKERPVPLQLVA